MSMRGAGASFMRPVTVLPRRIAAGGLISRTRTLKVPVTGSARGEPRAPYADRGDGRIAGRARPGCRDCPATLSLTEGRHVEDRVEGAFARHLDDHAARADDLADLGAAAR